MEGSPNQKPRMKKDTILQKCWVWNDTVEAFVQKLVRGYSLNVCAGKSSIGDVKIDLDPQNKAVLKGDMRYLPFESNTFDTVISDPPWKIGYYERFKPFFECVRVCKIGGTIIYNATWIPSCPSGDVRLVSIYARQDTAFSNTSVISVFEKIQDNPEYNHASEAKLAELLAKRGQESS